MIRHLPALLALALLAPFSPADDKPAPTPVAKKVPHVTKLHGDTRVDDYFGVREKKTPAVIDHLNAENAYMRALTGHLKDLEERLYKEVLGRMQQTDLTVPYREGGYYYYTRTQEG